MTINVTIRCLHSRFTASTSSSHKGRFLIEDRCTAKNVRQINQCSPVSTFRTSSTAKRPFFHRRGRRHPSRGKAAALALHLCQAMNDTAELVKRPGETPDAELIRRMAGGGVDAFAEFYDRHSTLLLSIAVKVLRDVHEAEEVLQDAARLVWENAPLYNPSLGKPASWAVVITRNKAIDRLRVLERKSAAINKLIEDAAADFLTQPHRMPGEALANETGDLLRSALAALPAEQRVAIELAFFTGLSQTEIATQLGQPLGTIKARIRRGMLTMRDVLEEQL